MKSVLSGAAVVYYLLGLRRNQWKSLQELEEIQLKRLKNVVRYAYDYIPYYRKLFKTVKFSPSNLKSLDDIGRIPTTSKKDVRNNYSDLIAKGVDQSKYNISYTSGSTGLPLKILRDRNANDYSTALVAYSSMACGLGLRDRIVEIGTDRSRTPFIPKKTVVPIPAESGELEFIISRLVQIKPDAIYTFPYLLNSLCTAEVIGIKPKLIFSHAGTITNHMRSLVKSKFSIDINDTYGAKEFNRMAFECNEHVGMHILTDNSVMEFLEDGEPVSPGETGEVFVTGLSNYAMPLIRYELGDLGVPSDEVCSCGRSWPLIKRVEGRILDIFTLESGRKLYPRLLHKHIHYELNKNIHCVLEYQLVQEEKNKITLKFVEGKKFDKKVIKNIKEKFDNEFKNINEDVNVEMHSVKEIPVEKSGKKKLLISLIN